MSENRKECERRCEGKESIESELVKNREIEQNVYMLTKTEIAKIMRERVREGDLKTLIEKRWTTERTKRNNKSGRAIVRRQAIVGRRE